MICVFLYFHSVFIGFTTDGEWNSLHAKGYTRPLSVFQIRSDARRKYAHMSLQKMIAMISPQCKQSKDYF